MCDVLNYSAACRRPVPAGDILPTEVVAKFEQRGSIAAINQL